MSAPPVSIIVPTLREAANVPVVARRVHAAMAGRPYELIFVDDDSRDGTVEACAALVAEELPVKLIVRTDRRDGLSGAVLAGLAAAQGGLLVVMDADLQHPPERIPALLEPIERGDAEFSLGSRYVEGGGVAEAWSRLRRLNSRMATLSAMPLAGGVHDPMSGFFALPRRVYERGRYIAPTGYKIALELLCKCRADPVREVPIHFAVRERGESKLSLKEQIRYLEHLSRLYDFTFPRLVPAAKFLITVTGALLIATAYFGLLRKAGALPNWWLVASCYAAGSCFSAAFHARYVRAERQYLIRKSPWRDFLLCTFAEVAAVGATAAYLLHRIPSLSAAELLLIPFAVGTVVRYLLRKELVLDVRGLRYIPGYSERRTPAAIDATSRAK
jgi:dolichol-phosphate mannosyltransferase